MSQEPPSTTDRIQEYFNPRPTVYSAPTPQRSMPRVQQQHTPRHIQLSDIQKPKKLHTEKKISRPLAGTNYDSLWSWLSGFFEDVKAKSSAQVSNNARGVPGTIPKHSHPATVHSQPGDPISRHSIVPYTHSRVRDAQQVAGDVQLQFGGRHYSLWGEIVCIFNSLKQNMAKKKAEAARQREREAKHRLHEEKARQKIACGPDDALAEEQAMPGRHPTLSPFFPLPPSLSQQIKKIAPESYPTITRKPAQIFSKTEGKVPKHTVKITHLPPIHHSVHLSKNVESSYGFRGEVGIDHTRKSSRITTLGDFMRKPSEPSDRLTRLPSHIPEPIDPGATQSLASKFYRHGNGTQWTFTVLGIDDELVHDSTPILPNVDLPKIIGERRESQVTANPRECILCGAINSPKTHYNRQGLWLCTACRSPTSAKEVPPPPAIPTKTTLACGKGRSRSFSPSPRGSSLKNRKVNEGTLFAHGDCSAPEFMHASMKPAPLNSLRRMRRRSSSFDSPVSPLTTDPFADFDSEGSDVSRQQIPASPDFRAMHARYPSNVNKTDNDWPPTPPLKDNYAYWPPKAPSPAIHEAPLLSSKSFKPPQPPSSTSRNSTRLSYYPDTPKFPPQTLESPTIPPRPIGKRPANKAKDQSKGAIKAKETLGLRAPPGIPSDFPFAPPPIPDDTLHKPKRSSSIYPEEDDERYILPAFDFAARLKRDAPQNRDTSFYDFWKPILEDRKE